jgi:AcrR family transcriptional regulator
LQQAALELFASRGYEQTTATEIAQAVGLTERTFFRHFSDKREVLFHGQDVFVQAFLDGVEAAPPGATPIELVGSALRSAAALFPDGRRSHSRARQAVIDQNPALRERESHKLAGLARAGRRQPRGDPGRRIRRHRLRHRLRTMAPQGRAPIPGRHLGRRIARAADAHRATEPFTQPPLTTVRSCDSDEEDPRNVELRGFEPLTPSMRTTGQAVYAGHLRRSVAISSRPQPMLGGPVAGRTAGP